MLHHLSAPHVYHVFKGDRESFVQAIEDAVDNPIQRSARILQSYSRSLNLTSIHFEIFDSYVLERMKMSSVEHRLGKILEHDWRAEAQVLLEQRKVSEQGPVSFPAGIIVIDDCLRSADIYTVEWFSI
jgi:hypothetical protein